MAEQVNEKKPSDIGEQVTQGSLGHPRVAVFTQDTSLRYTWMSSSQFGWSTREVLGRGDADLWPSDMAARLTNFKQRVLDTGVPAQEEIRVAYDGTTRFFELDCQPLRGDSGTIVGITCVSTDITRFRHVDEEWQFQALLLHNIHDAVIASDFDGRVTYWNDAAEQMFGYSAEEMIGQTLNILYPEQDFDELSSDLAAILDGNDYVGEWKGRRNDGLAVWVDIKTTLLRNAENLPIGFIGVSKDITRRKLLELERTELLAQSERANAKLQRFLASVAHDLRQPVTTIYGYAEMLRRRATDQHADRDLSKIQAIVRAADAIQRLSSDLYDASMIGAHGFIVDPKFSDLVAIAADVIEGLRIQGLQHRLLFNAPDRVLGHWDQTRIGQVITNLLTNAIKYTPAEGEIRVTIELHDGQAEIQVADDGPGIAPEHQRYLFEPFTRFSETDMALGMGLGLHICKGIVEAHHGQISVQSDLGQGTTFTVTLPGVAAAAHDPQDVTDSASAPPHSLPIPLSSPESDTR